MRKGRPRRRRNRWHRSLVSPLKNCDQDHDYGASVTARCPAGRNLGLGHSFGASAVTAIRLFSCDVKGDSYRRFVSPQSDEGWLAGARFWKC